MIQLKGSELYALVSPKECDMFKISGTNFVCSKSKLLNRWALISDQLDGKFEILGTFFNNEADFDVEPYLETLEMIGLLFYPNYNEPECMHANAAESANDSFASLLESNGLNPEAKYVILKKKP